MTARPRLPLPSPSTPAPPSCPAQHPRGGGQRRGCLRVCASVLEGRRPAGAWGPGDSRPRIVSSSSRGAPTVSGPGLTVVEEAEETLGKAG